MEGVRVPQLDGGQVLRLDLEDGQVGVGVGADGARLELLASGGEHLDAERPLHDVEVRDHDPVGADDEPGAGSLTLSPAERLGRGQVGGDVDHGRLDALDHRDDRLVTGLQRGDGRGRRKGRHLLLGADPAGAGQEQE